MTGEERNARLSADAYFQREMTDSPFVCPTCVRRGVEQCLKHVPLTMDELEWDENGKLRERLIEF